MLENVSCTSPSDYINDWNVRWIFYVYEFFTGESGASVRIFDPVCNRYISPQDNISVVRNRLKDKPLYFPQEM